ncbi:phospholipid/glycerol acyltransferase [Anaeromyxobacter sp. Fw109-5]|nr:phospholipid/glycerol acyltransferase [Anaeromyxobacter sp. Fw109-5]
MRGTVRPGFRSAALPWLARGRRTCRRRTSGRGRRAGGKPMWFWRRTPVTQQAAPAIDRALVDGTLVPLVERLVRLGWFSFEVEGVEHVPRAGRVVFAPNHAGWFPLDAFFLALAVRRALGAEATPYFAAADAALAAPVLGRFLSRVGALPASSFRRPERLPPEIRTVGVFPEGVDGNTKPFWEAYRMRPWKRGFVRVAAALDAPIVPVAILGGEESLPVAWTVRFLEPLLGSSVGLPVFALPLPARWKVVFHPPVTVGARGRAALVDSEYSSAVARAVQGTVQDTLDRAAANRTLAQVASLVAIARGAHLPARESEAPVESVPQRRPAARDRRARAATGRARAPSRHAGHPARSSP